MVFAIFLIAPQKLQIWLAWSGRPYLSSGEENVEILFVLIAPKRVGQRPGRIEPRAVKRRPKPFARLTVPRQVAREQVAKELELDDRPIIGPNSSPAPNGVTVRTETRVEQGTLQACRIDGATGDFEIHLHIDVGRTRMSKCTTSPSI